MEWMVGLPWRTESIENGVKVTVIDKSNEEPMGSMWVE